MQCPRSVQGGFLGEETVEQRLEEGEGLAKQGEGAFLGEEAGRAKGVRQKRRHVCRTAEPSARPGGSGG